MGGFEFKDSQASQDSRRHPDRLARCTHYTLLITVIPGANQAQKQSLASSNTRCAWCGARNGTGGYLVHGRHDILHALILRKGDAAY